jgi:hypothetical protein
MQKSSGRWLAAKSEKERVSEKRRRRGSDDRPVQAGLADTTALRCLEMEMTRA